jgi:cell division protein FtsI (penicillin-binding protein 3)
VRSAAANRRIVVLAVAFVLLLCASVMRAVWIQAVKGPEYAAMAARQHLETVVVPASRGAILDHDGNPLALGKQTVTAYANPRQVDQPRELALAAGRLLGAEPETLYPMLKDRSRGFVYVARTGD